MGLSLDELRDKSYTELVGASSEVADGLAVDIAKVLDTDEVGIVHRPTTYAKRGFLRRCYITSRTL